MNAQSVTDGAGVRQGGVLKGNHIIGAVVVNQAEADRDLPHLLEHPARVRFVLMKPLLGPVDLSWYLGACVWKDGVAICGNDYGHGTRLDWVIVGGESGPSARPLHPDWVRSLRDQCQDWGVPFLFRGWGEWIPMMGHAEGVPVSGPKFMHEDGTIMGRAGTKAAGRMLDGRTWDEFPKAVA